MSGYQMPYVSEGDDKFASKTMANISRAEWEDYKTRFLPKMRELMSSVDDPANRDRLISGSREHVEGAFKMAEQAHGDKMAAFGLADSGINNQQFQRQMKSEKTKSLVDAANRTRTHLDDRGNAIASGGLSDILNTEVV